MFFKYYTADLKLIGRNELITTSITIRVWFYTNPLNVVRMMKNQLNEWDLYEHKIFNLRRIK